MKYLKKLVSLGLVMSMLCACSQPSDKKDIKQQAIAFTQDLIDGKDGVEGHALDGLMSKIVQDGSLKKRVDDSLSVYGSFVEMKEATVDENIVLIPATFEKGSLIFRVGFNDSQEIQGITFNYEDTAMLPDTIVEEEVRLNINDTQSLGGTLTMPKGKTNVPVVILVHGSGSTNRDEEIGPLKVFRDIAWGLAEQGVATYRYDKRTLIYGQEVSKDITFTVDDETIDDAVNAVTMMKQQPNIDPEQVYVLGHSLGGYLMPRIAENADAAGYIMAAGPVTSILDLMEMQIDFLSGLTEDVAQLSQFEQMSSEVERARNLDLLKDDEAILGAYKTYWLDLQAYQPLVVAQQINKPVLVLQGEEDYQVPLEEMEIWKSEFGENSLWTFKSYSGLTHLFTAGEKKNGSADYAIPANVDQRVIDDIVEFIVK